MGLKIERVLVAVGVKTGILKRAKNVYNVNYLVLNVQMKLPVWR